MKYYGSLFYFCRRLIRCFYASYHVDHPERLQDPSVYLCRHFNTKGIFRTIPWLSGRIRPWALSVYVDRDDCFNHLMSYTLTKRFGWPKWKAWLTATPVASFLSALMRSARAIPVYRGSMSILKTYQMSIRALKQNESILIFPDRSYTSEDSHLTDLYEGFLMVDRLYFRETGRHIPFVTVYADVQTRIVRIAEPILFEGDVRDQAERQRVLKLIQSQLSGASDQEQPVKLPV